jgi:hypothetical protein
MAQLSEHFTLEEAIKSSTAERLGIDNTPTKLQLATMRQAAVGMEKVREILGESLSINSWLRQPELNVAIGGAAKSDHMMGWAVDFICPKFGTPIDIAKKLLSAGIKFDKMIWEHSWLHISFDPLMRQEVYTANFIKGQPTTYTKGIA